MILFLAAMESIPDSLYEAAEIDGASTWVISLDNNTANLGSHFDIGCIYDNWRNEGIRSDMVTDEPGSHNG